MRYGLIGDTPIESALIASGAGDALRDDLRTEAYDLVIMMRLVHHFDGATKPRTT
jgi:hypothetical protein